MLLIEHSVAEVPVNDSLTGALIHWSNSPFSYFVSLEFPQNCKHLEKCVSTLQLSNISFVDLFLFRNENILYSPWWCSNPLSLFVGTKTQILLFIVLFFLMQMGPSRHKLLNTQVSLDNSMQLIPCPEDTWVWWKINIIHYFMKVLTCLHSFTIFIFYSTKYFLIKQPQYSQQESRGMKCAYSRTKKKRLRSRLGLHFSLLVTGVTWSYDTCILFKFEKIWESTPIENRKHV